MLLTACFTKESDGSGASAKRTETKLVAQAALTLERPLDRLIAK
jgi:hypothetical protein